MSNKKCLKCSKIHDGSFGSGKYCSRSCANSRTHSAETKNKISNTLTEKYESGEIKSQGNLEAAREAHKKWVIKKQQELMNCEFSSLTYERLRKRVILEQKSSCIKCGLDEWLKEPIALEIDHKDGNNKNNSRDNVEALCPNCHAMTSTWRGRNKGNQRNRNKVSSDQIAQAYLETGNIRQALLKVGLAAKGGNYKRVKIILTKRGIPYKS